MLMKTSSRSLTEQLADRFVERIRMRLLVPGARLPSVRQCAQQHHVSPSTVVAAYDQLQAQGLIEAKRNRGFFVREGAPQGQVETPQAAPVGGLAQPYVPLSATALIRGMFDRSSAKPQPGMGVFPPDWLAQPMLAAALRKVTSTAVLNDLSLQYGEPLGDGALRRALAHKLEGMNVPTHPDRIITTVGATHALDLVSRTLLRAGDAVLVEEPGWAVEFARLRAMGLQLRPVPRGPDGPDVAAMERLCQAHRPRLFVSVSVLHNPTGYCLTPGAAHRVLQLAQRYDFRIVEDDTYSHLAPAHATRLCALDGLQRTIYVSGFAKVLVPNWRVGFMAAPADLVERLLDTKLLATLTTPSILERALAHCIEQGQLRRHAERLRTRLDAARGRSVRLALAAGCTLAAEPAGLFGWLDTGVDTDELAQRLWDQGYLLAPGSLFHAERRPSTLMRVNFATTQGVEFWRAFTRARAELAPGRSD